MPSFAKLGQALRFTFPSDYKFHYPELSVMFDIPEEDTYKFCMRTRIEDSVLDSKGGGLEQEVE